MERFAADSIRAERDAHIKAALKNNVPWTDIAEQFGLTIPEIEKMILDSTAGKGFQRDVERKGSALIVRTAPEGVDIGKGGDDRGW